MARELDPLAVARRLEALSSMFVAETVAEGRARLLADASEPGAFASAVARRLDVLRALDELTRYLQASPLAQRRS